MPAETYEQLLDTVQIRVNLGDGLGDRGEAVEVLPVADGGAAGRASVVLFRVAACVDDMPAAGHLAMAGRGEALEADGTLQRLVDVLECGGQKADFRLGLVEVVFEYSCPGVQFEVFFDGLVECALL